MAWSIEFSPFLPWPALVAIGLAGLLLLGLLLYGRRPGSLLRAGSLSLILLALANPSLRQEERESLADIVAVAIDRSTSQKITGRLDLVDRLENSLRERLGKLNGVETRWATTPGAGRASERDGTTLFEDLGRVLSEIPPERLAGVLLVTDGRIHDVPAKAAELGVQVPVHAIITGNENEFDRRIEVLKAPRFGLVGSTQTAQVKVIETPASKSDSVTLTIRREGEPDERLVVQPGQPVDLPVRFPHAGLNIVELDVEAEPGELTTTNNKAVLAAEGVRENLRVLLVSGEPHAGERTWRNLLKSDAAVDLVHFTILRPPEKQDGTPINQLSLIAFPTRELFSEKLDEFDLIIFDRYHRRGVLPLLYLDNVARYVEKGGAVLIAAGEDYASPTSLYRTPLSSILPAAPTGRVMEQPFRPAISKTGARHPVTRGLTEDDAAAPKWGRWFRLVESSDVEGSVLMNGPEEKPLLVLNRLEKGRVALLLSDHAWLWARGYDGGGPYTALLRRLAHWLMKEPDLEEDVLRLTGEDDGLVIERHSMSENIGPVELTTPSGGTSDVALEPAAPGVWRKRLDTAEQGIYRAKSGELAAVAHVGTLNSRELATLTATDEVLRPILDETGGGSFWSAGTGAEAAMPRIAMLRAGNVMHGSDWIGLRKRDAYVTRGVRLIPLFSGFLALAVLLGAISFTWYREGR
ncbi:MAG: hypothetical protein VX871_08265 [Pseudomonadota bacterium]|nr:hypothetical protein [Pseudomonadota bacterium]